MPNIRENPFVRAMIADLKAVKPVDLYTLEAHDINAEYLFLLQEHFRRLALFIAEHKPLISEVWKVWPFGNAAAVFVEFDDDDRAYVDDEIAMIQLSRGFMRCEKPMMANIIYWLASYDQIETTLDPYDPLIDFFLRGGSLRCEHGFIDVGPMNIFVGFYDKWLRLPSFDERRLTYLKHEEVGGEAYEYAPIGKYIVRATDVCGGRPTFKYTRIEVAGALQRLAAGEPLADIVAGYRGRVSREAMQEAIDLARTAPNLIQHTRAKE